MALQARVQTNMKWDPKDLAVVDKAVKAKGGSRAAFVQGAAIKAAKAVLRRAK